MAILVTGGAGYIGSHVVRQLSEAKADVLVLDNLSTGFKEALIHGEKLIVADLADERALDQLFQSHSIDSVIHFAASIVVPESMSDPLKYYMNNTMNTLKLVQACVKHKVKNFIFSSTAAVYGKGDKDLTTEETPPRPVSVYGHSKLMSEQIIKDVAVAHGLRYLILRYFNVAGADPGGRMGQRTRNATHLIKVSCEAALGRRAEVSIFGDTFATPDGTGVRDYVHVEDLASAHIRGIEYLKKGGDSTILNVGYGKGYSVREVIEAVKNVSGVNFKIKVGPPRLGDPEKIVAKADRVRQLTGWAPKHDDLLAIARDSLNWEKKMI